MMAEHPELSAQERARRFRSHGTSFTGIAGR